MVKTSRKQRPHYSLHRTKQHFKGVRMRKGGKWVSEVRMPNSTRRIWLGSYNTPQQAARAYDCAVYCLRGCKAKFNFPDCLPEISSASLLSPAQIQAAAAKFALKEPPVSESQCRTNNHQTWVEQDWTVLDSLLDDVENNQSLCLQDFPEENLEGFHFVLLMEEQGGLILQQTED